MHGICTNDCTDLHGSTAPFEQGDSLASIYKSDNRWRVQIRKRGTYLSESFATKAQAERWAAKKETEIDEGKLRNTKGDGKTVSDALLEYGRRVSIHKDGNAWEQRRLKWFAASELGNLLLSDIDASDIAAFRDKRLLTVKSSTVNRDFNLLSHVFNTAKKEWLWIDRNPCSDVRRPKEPPARERRVTKEEIKTMRFVLGYEKNRIPETIKQLVCNYWLISIETGMRLSEVNSITEDTFFENEKYVYLAKTKNGEKRDAACSKKAI